MNAKIKNNIVCWFSRAGSVVLQRQFGVAIVWASLALVGFTPVIGQEVPVDAKKTTATKSASIGLPFSIPDQPYHKVRLATKPSSEAIEPGDSSVVVNVLLGSNAARPTDPCDGNLMQILDFLNDGLEFAIVGAEISNQFSVYQQISSVYSWVSQDLFQANGSLFVERLQPDALSWELVADLSIFLAEEELATWMLQQWN